MPRTTLPGTLALSFACVFGGTALGAQTTTPTAPETAAVTDSAMHVRMLPAQRITATKSKATREGVLALMEENRRLAAELRRQDAKVETLTRRLAYLKGHVTDSLTTDIARLDAQAAETRSRRQALEARLNALEGGFGSATVAP